MKQNHMIAAAVLFVVGLFLLLQYWPNSMSSDLDDSPEVSRVSPVRSTAAQSGSGLTGSSTEQPKTSENAPANKNASQAPAQNTRANLAPRPESYATSSATGTNATSSDVGTDSTARPRSGGTIPAARTTSQAPTRNPTAERPPLQVQIQQRELQDLQAQLAAERMELQEQNDTLASLQRQKTEEEQRNAQNVASQISSRNMEIQNLTDQLQNLRLSEQDILEATASALRDQSSQMQIVREQIDQSIRVAEDGIAQTQEQMQFWSQNNYNITDKQTQLANLQAILSQQQQALNDLRLQRLNMASQVLLQRQNIETQAQQQKGSLINDQNQIQTRIADLRAELQQLQDQQARRQLTPIPITDQIRQTQEALNEQVTRVQALESNIQSKQNELTQTR